MDVCLTSTSLSPPPSLALSLNQWRQCPPVRMNKKAARSPHKVDEHPQFSIVSARGSPCPSRRAGWQQELVPLSSPHPVLPETSVSRDALNCPLHRLHTLTQAGRACREPQLRRAAGTRVGAPWGHGAVGFRAA